MIEYQNDLLHGNTYYLLGSTKIYYALGKLYTFITSLLLKYVR